MSTRTVALQDLGCQFNQEFEGDGVNEVGNRSAASDGECFIGRGDEAMRRL
jgi:hypothetical protein